MINDERFAEDPDIKAFESSDAYDVLLRAAGDKKLVKLVEMEFVRQLIKVDTGRSMSALSFDDGVIHGENGDSVILEMEVEWYHGDEDDFREVATSIAEKFDLKPENASKLQRGFAQDVSEIGESY